MAANKVYVIGMGMGNPDTLTKRALDALAESELVVGSQRLIDALDFCDAPLSACIDPQRIAMLIRVSNVRVASVVMSGDVGFYSGATRLYDLLDGFDIEAVPGVSSLAYLCAHLKTSWQDVHIVSAHGRAVDVAGAVQAHARTFILAGGDRSPEALCADLVTRGLGQVRVHVGERLSYADERISSGTAARLASGSFDGLAVLLVENEHPVNPRSALPGLPDGAFERARVPMTKKEVRELALCKLRVCPTDVVWDVGAGTGSVSVEAARAAYEGRVLAIEHKVEATALLARNKERFALPNIQVVEGEAPIALRGLPAPDKVFVGGSMGRMDGIVDVAIEANPAIRICATAITLETLGEFLACARARGLRNLEIVQVSVARSEMVGERHLMRGANPVYLMSADGPAVVEATGGVDEACR